MNSPARLNIAGYPKLRVTAFDEDIRSPLFGQSEYVERTPVARYQECRLSNFRDEFIHAT
jgi:hypothetical protein